MMTQLEGKFGLRLCIANRDMLAGAAQFQATAAMIRKRCVNVLVSIINGVITLARMSFHLRKWCDFFNLPNVPPNVFFHIVSLNAFRLFSECFQYGFRIDRILPAC